MACRLSCIGIPFYHNLVDIWRLSLSTIWRRTPQYQLAAPIKRCTFVANPNAVMGSLHMVDLVIRYPELVLQNLEDRTRRIQSLVLTRIGLKYLWFSC